MTSLHVELLTYTPEPEKIVATAAKLCYSASEIKNLMDNLTLDKIESFVKMLESYGHESPFEHASFTFGIEGVSRSLLAQITRHRIASYSVQSQRYVKLDNFSYVIPPAIEAIPAAKAKFIQAMEDDQRTYNELINVLMFHYMAEDESLHGINYESFVNDNNYLKGELKNKVISLEKNLCMTKFLVRYSLPISS